MASKNEAGPESKGKHPDWRQFKNTPRSSKQNTECDWYGTEDESSDPDPFKPAKTIAPKDAKETHNSDQSHHKDRQVIAKKRQAADLAPGDQKAMKYQKVTGSDAVQLLTKNSNIWQGTKVAPWLYGTGYIAKLNHSRTEGQILQKILISPLAKEGSMEEINTPVSDGSCEFDVVDAIGGQLSDESRDGKYLVEKKSKAATHTQPVARPHQAAVSAPRPVNEGTGQSGEDGDEAAADTAHEAHRNGLLKESKIGRYSEWQDLLIFMDLSKSRLLENEPALKFLRSLEPRIINDSNGSLLFYTLFLSLARMANIPQRRERFEEYLVEATREWYCLTTVYKYGYEDETALASEENCECPQKQKPCLQVRIRRGKLGAFDVRFK